MRAKRIATVAIWMILALASCQKRNARVAAPPAPVSTSAPRPASPPSGVAALERANSAFGTGAYDEAVRAYEQSLQLSLPSAAREQALFRLGLAFVLRSNTNPDWPRATTLLKQLVDEYPNSTFKPPAALILSLHAELDQVAADSKARDQRIRQLTTELDRMKQIDAQRRTRP